MSSQGSKFRAATFFFLLVFLVGAGASFAQDFFGCYRCAYPRLHPTSPYRSCEHVGDLQSGATACSHEDGVCFSGTQQCVNTVVDGGDGGGGGGGGWGAGGGTGGGGGGGCLIGPVGFCPLSCGYCIRQLV
jgi:hypothetical protein